MRPALPVHTSIEPLVVADVRDEHRFPVLEHPPGDPSISGEADGFQALCCLRADVTSHGEKQLLPLLIQQEEGTALCLQDLLGLGDDCAEQFLKIDQSAKGSAQLQEEGELLDAGHSCLHHSSELSSRFLLEGLQAVEHEHA